MRKAAGPPIMPILSDSVIQSVRMRATGGDSYVDPSPYSPMASQDRRQPLQPAVSNAWQPSDAGVSAVTGAEALARPASLDHLHPLPSLSVLCSVATHDAEEAWASPTASVALGKRLRDQHDVIDRHDAHEPRRKSLDAVFRPRGPPRSTSETRRVSPTTAASPVRASSTVDNCPSQSGDGDVATVDAAVQSAKPQGAAGGSAAGSVTSEVSAGAKPKKKRVRIKSERRREQCRANQARYRNKQRAIRLAFHETLDHIRDEVKMLEAKRRELTYGLHVMKSPWNVVVDYFRLFRHGACVRTLEYSDASSPLESSVAGLYLETEYGEEQLAFLRSVMAPDVNLVGYEGDGVDALAEQWVSWSRSCNAIELHLERIEKVPGPSHTLAATATVHATVTESTVRSMFPHFLARYRRDQSECECETGVSELGWSLCGRRLEVKCVMWFECEPRTSQVLRLRSQFDLIPSLRSALGSLRDVARVLDGAVLGPDGFFRSGHWQRSNTPACEDYRHLGSATNSSPVAGWSATGGNGEEESVGSEECAHDWLETRTA